MKKSKNTTGSNWIDPDAAPELSAEWFKSADLYDGKKLVRRGRPPKKDKKLSIHILLDRDLAEKFRATGKGRQTRLNALLRKAIEKYPL